jgi:hypothetical protein
MAPPQERASRTEYAPSAGDPMASERTRVSGRSTGSMMSVPAANAVAMGAQPAAWPPTKRMAERSMRPTSASSSKPRAILVYSDPEASGTTTTSGVRHPSCCATS